MFLDADTIVSQLVKYACAMDKADVAFVPGSGAISVPAVLRRLQHRRDS